MRGLEYSARSKNYWVQEMFAKIIMTNIGKSLSLDLCGTQKYYLIISDMSFIFTDIYTGCAIRPLMTSIIWY
jgi:hypothetical protein